MSGSRGSMTRSMNPVSALRNNCRQVRPPSVVLYRPRSGFGPHSRPRAATYTISGLVGWMTIRPMCAVSASPLWSQVLAPSGDLYRPLPQDTLLRGLASPVPTQTTSGFEGATATSPMETVSYWSKTGVQVVPLLTVFHRPPDAEAAYMTAGL